MMLRITPGERSALQLLAEGKATGELARRLSISEGEVEAQLTSLFARMGATTRKEAVAAAIRRGLLSSAS